MVDHDGNPLFSDDCALAEHKYVCCSAEEHLVEVIQTAGNIWFPASTVIDLMGMNAKETKHSGRVLRRIEHPDVIKIADTPFRFSDGRRNRGSLISPRALQVFGDGGTKGYHPIKANAFLAWVQDDLLRGDSLDKWSPKAAPKVQLEPKFREVTKVFDEDEQGRPLDPLRPTGPYRNSVNPQRLQPDEVEFCLGGRDCEVHNTCWCGGKGGLLTYNALLALEAAGLQNKTATTPEDDMVIDDDDDFTTGYVPSSLRDLALWSHAA